MKKTVKISEVLEEAKRAADWSKEERAKGNETLANSLRDMVTGMENIISLAIEETPLTEAWDNKYMEIVKEIWHREA